MNRYGIPTKTPNVWLILLGSVFWFCMGAGLLFLALAYFGILWR